MKLPLYVVDAFTAQVFKGNPAAVCLLQDWLDAATLQAIAAENNLAETAFLVAQEGGWQLRWFTPRVEVELCGHATLASAVVLTLQDPSRTEFRFHTLSGELRVSRQDNWYTLDFPVRSLQPLTGEPALTQALGSRALALTQAASTVIVELADEAAVLACQPDLVALKALRWRGVSITARSEQYDFVSRFFAPQVGVDEDAVTGSAHCGLTPYWAAKLGKPLLFAKQVSPRGGELRCELKDDRVLISGQGALYSQGEILL